jgi:hypothetical protein
MATKNTDREGEKYWRIAYWILLICWVTGAILFMARIKGGFLTNYLSDLTFPAWYYIYIRGLSTAGRQLPTILFFKDWFGVTPNRSITSIFSVGFISELTTFYWPKGIITGTFDYLDIVAYAIGLLVCYCFDLRLVRQEIRVRAKGIANCLLLPINIVTAHFLLLSIVLSSFILNPQPPTKMSNPSAESYTVSTLAGGESSSTPCDGAKGEAKFSNDLADITTDLSGHVYVIDGGSVRKISPDGNVKTLFGSNIYDRTGKPIEVKRFESSTDNTYQVAGFAIDKAKNTMYLSTQENSLFKLPLSGPVNPLWFAGPKEVGVVNDEAAFNTHPNGDGNLKSVVFRKPLQMSVDKAGNIYLNDKYRMLRKISVSGQVTTLAGKRSDTSQDAENPVLKPGAGTNASLANMGGIAVDSKGNIFVAQPDIFCIVKVTPNGTVSTFAGDPTSTDGSPVDGKGTAARFLGPKAVAIDGSDNIYVADKYKVRMITPAGVVTTIAGASKQYDWTVAFLDGDGSVALFTSIKGIACDDAGNIYVTDEGRVRKISFK